MIYNMYMYLIWVDYSPNIETRNIFGLCLPKSAGNRKKSSYFCFLIIIHIFVYLLIYCLFVSFFIFCHKKPVQMHISKTRYVKFNNKSTQLVCYCCQTTPVVLQKRTTPVVLHNNLISNLLSKLVSLGKIRNSLLLQRMTKTRQSKQ